MHPQNTRSIELSALGRHALANPAPGTWMPLRDPAAINLASGYPFAEAIPLEPLRETFLSLIGDEGDRPFQYMGSPSVEALHDWIHQRMGAIMASSDRMMVTLGRYKR